MPISRNKSIHVTNFKLHIRMVIKVILGKMKGNTTGIFFLKLSKEVNLSRDQ